MDFAKFKLLMWKNYRLRRYHWLVTFIEFGVPILITFSVVKFTALFGNSNLDKRNATIYEPTTRDTFLSGLKGVGLYYTPSNPSIDDFMNGIGITPYFEFVRSCVNDSEMEAILRNGSHKVAISSNYFGITSHFIGISFKNIVSNKSLPDKLSYELRNNDRWNTRNLYPEYDPPGPYVSDPYRFKNLAPVQLLINEEFIKLKANTLSLKELKLEWFPYPEYIRETSPRHYITQAICLVIAIIVLIASIPLINDVIEEKDSGIKELMKISGLDEWMMWCSWFLHAFIVSFVSITVVVILLTFPLFGDGTEAIHYVNFSVLWLFLVFYIIANISFCFMFSSLFQKTSIASSIFVIAFILSYFGTILLSAKYPDSGYLKLLTLTPIGAYMMGFNKISYYEVQGVQFTWDSVNVSENNANSVSLLFCLLMLLFDACLYFFLAYYITSINPGKFGARKSPFFIFEKLFSNFSKNDTQPLQNLDEKVESEFVEAPPANIEATIQMKDLHKYFGLVYAVRGVNLNIYQGEMTALLGHNGAGKTTTMSILTGLTSPSAGSIHFKNMDIFKNMEQFRKNLGMCPQENRTMPYLTVLEHLTFFGQLKGISRKEAEAEAEEYLTMMDLQPKRNALAKELSGGMKRKLCLSIALMGKAEVLILDEPTSGMDVQSRRKLWDLLLDLRGERTVIFTTHYMEEADALGDRIAIMNHGVIVCHGTPLFLKKAYGTGYELTITKSEENSIGIDNLVKKIMPDASQEFDAPKETVYKLPLTQTDKFPSLFKSLEAEQAQLGIKSMGVAATTMEHVFLKVGGVSIYDTKAARNTTVTDSTRESNYLRHIKGLSLYYQQISAILKKKYLYTSRNLFAIFTRVVIPTGIGLFLLSLLNHLDFSPEPPLDLSQSTYPGSTVVLRNAEGGANFAKCLEEYIFEKGGSFVNAEKSPIETELLDHAKNILRYNKNYITAFELNASTIKVLYNLPLLHSLPISITTYSNVLLRNLTNTERYQIETFNYPVFVPPQHGMDGPVCGSQEFAVPFYFLWFFALAFYSVDFVAYFAGFVNMERIDGFKHIQMMSNVSPLVYWFGTLVFDVGLFLFVTALRVVFYKLVNNTTFLGFDPSLGVFLLIIILYSVAGLLFVYVTSFLFSSKDGSYTLLFLFNMICCIVVGFFYGAEQALHFGVQLYGIYKLLFYVAKFVILIVPSFNFALLFIKLMMIFNYNSSCSMCSEALKADCERMITKKAYLEFASENNLDGLLLGVIFLCVEIILYASILTFINMGYVRAWYNLLKNRMYGAETTNKDEGDYDVKQEYDKVQQYKEDRTQRNQVTLLVDGLRKNYISWFKPFTAVSKVSFTVEPGECFGLLGVNGAGKSTTFKMLTGEIEPTLGDSAIDTIKLSTDKMQYLSMAGYCPQTNCFVEELTGREMLTMIAAMRGVSGNENKALVNKWINIIALEEFQNQRCGTYSGGNKRKLCTAMSLIGDPRVVFLDEPTSGVDPVSRRSLYDVMGQSKESGQAVILTSHSMEECETLCDRLTIMVSGVMKCIGTTQHLKKRYAQGFSVLIKINDISYMEEKIKALKENMTKTFSAKYCILKDEHRGLLYYQIKDTSLPWSTLFEKMEAMKNLHKGLLEDYILTDTTLEEVFISFAKECSYPTSATST